MVQFWEDDARPCPTIRKREDQCTPVFFQKNLKKVKEEQPENNSADNKQSLFARVASQVRKAKKTFQGVAGEQKEEKETEEKKSYSLIKPM